MHCTQLTLQNVIRERRVRCTGVSTSGGVTFLLQAAVSWSIADGKRRDVALPWRHLFCIAVTNEVSAEMIYLCYKQPPYASQAPKGLRISAQQKYMYMLKLLN